MQPHRALAMVLPVEHGLWLAPLIVGVVVMMVGYAVFAGGKSALKARKLKPTRSSESLREDSRMVKEHLT